MTNTYQHELAMCKKLHAEKQGCAWGKCDQCGVIPLLHKLSTGEVIDDPAAINKLKQQVFE